MFSELLPVPVAASIVGEFPGGQTPAVPAAAVVSAAAADAFRRGGPLIRGRDEGDRRCAEDARLDGSSRINQHALFYLAF